MTSFESPTLPRVIELARKNAENMGLDYVYPESHKAVFDEDESACQYTHNGAPSCLVGHVLADLGVPVSVLADMENRGANRVSEDLFGFGVDPRAANYLYRVQRLQDAGFAWGVAVEAGLSQDAMLAVLYPGKTSSF